MMLMWYFTIVQPCHSIFYTRFYNILLSQKIFQFFVQVWMYSIIPASSFLLFHLISYHPLYNLFHVSFHLSLECCDDSMQVVQGLISDSELKLYTKTCAFNLEYSYEGHMSLNFRESFFSSLHRFRFNYLVLGLVQTSKLFGDQAITRTLSSIERSYLTASELSSLWTVCSSQKLGDDSRSTFLSTPLPFIFLTTK